MKPSTGQPRLASGTRYSLKNGYTAVPVRMVVDGVSTSDDRPAPFTASWTICVISTRSARFSDSLTNRFGSFHTSKASMRLPYRETTACTYRRYSSMLAGG